MIRFTMFTSASCVLAILWFVQVQTIRSTHWVRSLSPWWPQPWTPASDGWRGEVPSLLLRPLWRLAASKRIWHQWIEQVPKVPVREEGLGLPKDLTEPSLAKEEARLPALVLQAPSSAVAREDPEEALVKGEAAPKAVAREEVQNQGKKASKKHKLQDWSRQSLAMLQEMGWSRPKH
ncbi:unnamed protein product [Durusdinium trenchii]|uniref:Uncharacterized protein n=1 Tax=Durusdinium trenchii TaxID=1381693 RepID=A0ABP0KS19_9DINO